MFFARSALVAFVAATASSLTAANPISLEARTPTFDGKCIALSSASLAAENKAIRNAYIVPDVYNSFDPKTTVALYYNEKFVPYGDKLTATQTLLQPNVYFPAPEGDQGDKYTVIINDPDVPLGITHPTFLHWIKKGLTPNCQTPASDSGQDVRIYISPTPPPVLAPTEHRYTISILREPKEGYNPSALKYLTELITFDVNEYEKNTGAKLVGSTYFLGSAT
ncbi:PEBP-like protein [Meira miltonrushii]|uniref:PEBP-like protein n=1 Tax=Meira miltonrushii TaxID=1280837 RepID=A0A316V9G5_9BASI|nr:PEBP-like protein [Meira miltonrushii]PWN34140.1 PEBP-like protein [Meira miltonrushii]